MVNRMSTFDGLYGEVLTRPARPARPWKARAAARRDLSRAKTGHGHMDTGDIMDGTPF